MLKENTTPARTRSALKQRISMGLAQGAESETVDLEEIVGEFEDDPDGEE